MLRSQKFVISSLSSWPRSVSEPLSRKIRSVAPINYKGASSVDNPIVNDKNCHFGEGSINNRVYAHFPG